MEVRALLYCYNIETTLSSTNLSVLKDIKLWVLFEKCNCNENLLNTILDL